MIGEPLQVKRLGIGSTWSDGYGLNLKAPDFLNYLAVVVDRFDTIEVGGHTWTIVGTRFHDELVEKNGLGYEVRRCHRKGVV